MSEALGLAANIFGVVGAADVVFWSTANICDLLKRAKDAPAAASQLLGATRSLASVIAELRIWANEYQQLFRTSENGRRVEKEVFSALSRCAGELEALVKKLESHDIRKNRRSWAGRLAGNVGFAMSEAQIHHAMQMVIHHQTTLRTLIQVQGSRDIWVLRHEVGNLNVNLKRIEQTVVASSEAIQVASSAIRMIGDVQNTRPNAHNIPRLQLTGSEIGQQALQITQPETSSTPPIVSTRRPLNSVTTNFLSQAGTSTSDSSHYPLQDSFQAWCESNSRPTTCSVYSFASFTTRQTAAGQPRIEILPFDLADATPTILLARQVLTPMINQLANAEIRGRIPRNPYISQISASGACPCAGRSKQHFCRSCVGPDAYWVLSCLGALVKQALLASLDRETNPNNTNRNTLPGSLLPSSSSLQFELARTNETLGFATPGSRPFHHVSASKSPAGNLAVRWEIYEQFYHEFNAFSFAYMMDSPGGPTGIFANFITATCFAPMLYRSIHDYDLDDVAFRRGLRQRDAKMHCEGWIIAPAMHSPDALHGVFMVPVRNLEDPESSLGINLRFRAKESREGGHPVFLLRTIFYTASLPGTTSTVPVRALHSPFLSLVVGSKWREVSDAVGDLGCILLGVPVELAFL